MGEHPAKKREPREEPRNCKEMVVSFAHDAMEAQPQTQGSEFGQIPYDVIELLGFVCVAEVCTVNLI